VAGDLARCIPLVDQGNRHALSARQAERDEYARQAIGTLRRAIGIDSPGWKPFGEEWE
jgi:hypothetical protein